jgi:hypothetical protein
MCNNIDCLDPDRQCRTCAHEEAVTHPDHWCRACAHEAAELHPDHWCARCARYGLAA